MNNLFKTILFFVLAFFATLFLPDISRANNFMNYQADASSTNDLLLNSISVSPKSPAINQDCIITVTIKNNGKVNLATNKGIGAFTKTFQDFSTESETYPNILGAQPVKPGASATYIFKGRFTSTGIKTLYFYIDPDNEMVETNENNNEKNTSVNIVPLDQIDLSVASIEFDKTDIVANDPLKITVKIKNTGKVSMIDNLGFFKDESPLREKDALAYFPGFIITSQSHDAYPSADNPFEPNESFAYTYIGYFNNTSSSTLNFKIDAINLIAETNESNNFLDKQIFIYGNSVENNNFLVSNIKTSLVSSSSIIIYWQTNKDVVGSLYYRDTDYGDYSTYKNSFSISKWPQDAKAGTVHQLTIKGLKGGEKYYFTISGQRNGYIQDEKENTFTMPLTDSISLANDLQVLVDNKKVTASWSTDLVSSGYLFYRLLGAKSYKKAGSTSLASDHEVKVENLPAGEYEYYIESQSSGKLLFKSAIGTFKISEAISNSQNTASSSSPAVSSNQSASNENSSVMNRLVVTNKALYGTQKGKILLKVESKGEAYYVHPVSQEMFYLGRPNDAFQVMREMGIGIKNSDLNKIQVGLKGLSGLDSDGDGLPDTMEEALGTNKDSADSDKDGNMDKKEIESNFNPNLFEGAKIIFDQNFASKQKGKIFIQVEGRGEAWYINPSDGKRYFLGRPTDAFNLMRNLGLGISNSNFNTMIK
jgi:hypothetical protein